MNFLTLALIKSDNHGRGCGADNTDTHSQERGSKPGSEICKRVWLFTRGQRKVRGNQKPTTPLLPYKQIFLFFLGTIDRKAFVF